MVYNKIELFFRKSISQLGVGRVSHRILVVEDDNDINQLLAELLGRAGYEVVQAYSGTEARLLFTTEKYSLLLLDLMLPGLSGEELISLMRQQSNLPIIVLSAKEAAQDKINALKTGADDYVSKPFNGEELLARVEAALRRSQSQLVPEQQVLQFKDIVLDGDSRRVTQDEKELILTAREFDILALLMGSPKKVFTKNNLYRSVWKDEFLGDDNTVNVHISNLRNKLGGKEYIQTVWGIGFKLCD